MQHAFVHNLVLFTNTSNDRLSDGEMHGHFYLDVLHDCSLRHLLLLFLAGVLIESAHETLFDLLR